MQELLAPKAIQFYDAKWQYLGSKQSLAASISEVTGIDPGVLSGKRYPRQYSIAQRMSWAAGRRTSRREDRAYSLLGLFVINMPMLYGEGGKAFIRLQEEIIKESDDHSIFAWTGAAGSGALAPSPDMFAASHDVVSVRARQGRSLYTINNRGVSMHVALAPYCCDTYLVIRNCARAGSIDKLMGIFLRPMYEDDQWTRVDIDGEGLVDDAVGCMQN